MKWSEEKRDLKRGGETGVERESVSVAWCAGVLGVAGVLVLLTQEMPRVSGVGT
jgi:hypothetical protein